MDTAQLDTLELPPEKRQRIDSSRGNKDDAKNRNNPNDSTSYESALDKDTPRISPGLTPTSLGPAMADSNFNIPGLGQAKPDEILPAESFAPDVLAAAASTGGEDMEPVEGTNDGQWERQEAQRRADAKPSKEKIEETGATAQSHVERKHAREGASDLMEIDKPAEETGLQQDLTTVLNGSTEQLNDAAPPSPYVAHALEAALDGLLSKSVEPADSNIQEQRREEQNDVEENSREWETDSSPFESSSSESETSSDSDDSDEEEDGYKLLGIEETARLLMAESEADGGGKAGKGGTGAQVRTKNEVLEDVLPKPDITITPEMKIELLGMIESIVGSTLVINSAAPGEVQVLDTGSVLCRSDRTVIGALAETLGNVRRPMYTVGIATPEDIKELELDVGSEVFYSVDHAKYVFTQALREIKGSDASNLHDEEVGADEMEFSDDEKEAEYKKQLKAKKRGNKAGRGGREQSNGHPHPLSNSSIPPASDDVEAGLNYDEDEDGPYKPLTRPPDFGRGLPPKPDVGFSQPNGGHGGNHRGGSSRGGGRGDFRGRGGRGGRGGGGRGDRHQQGRGGRGRGRGGGGHGGFGYDGTSSSPPPANARIAAQAPQNPHLPPPPYGAVSPPLPQPSSSGMWPNAPPTAYQPPPPPPPAAYSQGPAPSPVPPPPSGAFNFSYQAPWNRGPAQPPPQTYQYTPQHQAPQHHPLPSQQQPSAGYGALAPAPAPAWQAAGAYVNPAFFRPGQQAQHQAQLHQAQHPLQHHQQPQQQHTYWGSQQQPHGSYGQAPR